MNISKKLKCNLSHINNLPIEIPSNKHEFHYYTVQMKDNKETTFKFLLIYLYKQDSAYW